MKNFLKKCISLVLVAMLAAGTIGTYLSGASAEVEATDTAETPKYMAKIVPTSNDQYSRVGQRVTNVSVGDQFNISYKVYVIEAGLLRMWADEVAYPTDTRNVSNAPVEVTATYTATDKNITSGKSYIYFNFQCGSGAFYIYDLSITKVGGDGTNLLSNADWSTSSGSWRNWIFSGYNGGAYKMTDTLAKSYAYANASGRKIIEYNEDLFSQNIQNRETLEQPMYMARMVGSADDISGNDNLRIQQTVTVDTEKTYTLSYYVYIVTKGNIQGFLNSGDVDTVRQGQDSAGTCVKKSIEGFKPTSTTTTVRFETNAGESYVWGITFTEDGGDGTNLLTNSDFTQGGGAWIGWTFGSDYGYNYQKMTTVEESKTAEETTQRKILPYGMFASEEIATWTAEPILEETLDFHYKTEVTAAMTDGTTPSMTFKMVSDGNLVDVETVTGVLEDDGRYSYSFKVLPQHLSHNIIATLAVTTSTAGVQKVQIKEYSVKEYCAELLADDSSDESLKDLIADLLRYGAQTQAAFNQADTITNGLSDSMSGYGSEALLTNAVYVSNLLSGDNTNATYKWKSASLVLDGKVTIRLKFTASDVTGLTVKIGSDAYEIHTGDGYYYVDIPMMATAFDKIIIAQFFEGDAATGATLSYSVNTYLYRKQNSEKEGDLLLSVYRYGQSADSYYAYLNPGVTETLDNEIADNWDL